MSTRPDRGQGNYANIGYAGRKTGVVLKDTGDRDEYGMPNIDDLFSPSPQSEVNGISGATEDHASNFHSSPRKSLPRARSPIKTSIGSPRKSINSSPTKALLASPVRLRAVNNPERAEVFLNNKHKRRSLEQAPKRPPKQQQALRRSLYDVPSSPAVAKKEDAHVNGTTTVPSNRGSSNTTNIEASSSPTTGKQSHINGHIAAEDKGRRRFSDIEAAERAPLPPPVIQDADDYEFQADIGGDDEEIDFGPEHEVSIEVDHDSPRDSPVSSPKPLPIVPVLKRRSPLYDGVQEQTPSPAKKQRKTTQQPPQQVMLPPAKPFRNRKEPEKRQITLEPVSQPTLPTSPFRKSRPKGRGLQIVKNKSESESEIDGSRYTRSGRTSVKPVEYWRGERVIYTAPRREEGRISLPGIQDVIRVEDEPQTRRPTKRKPGKRQHRELSIESQDEAEQWETDPGVFTGEVPSWDPEKQRGDPDFSEAVDIALAPLGWEALTKEVQGASFQFAKALTLPFFHAGMVDLPPGGEKTLKNSRRNHMVFLVFGGRVIVDVSGNQFSLGRGGFWQVPRGNTYSMKNPYNKPARIFFSQACYMTEAEGTAHEEAEAVQE